MGAKATEAKLGHGIPVLTTAQRQQNTISHAPDTKIRQASHPPLGRAARQWVETTLTSQTMADRTAALYERLLAPAPTADALAQMAQAIAPPGRARSPHQSPR